MAVPVPLDPSAGDILSAVNFDAGVRDVFNFLLTDYPRVHAWAGSASIPNSPAAPTLVYYLVDFDSETYDTDSMHDPVVNPSRIKFPTAGLYEIDYLFTLANGTYTGLSLNVRLNSAGSASGGSSIRTQPYMLGDGSPNVYFRFTRFMSAGDYLEAFIAQRSGGASALSGTSLGTRCFARWIATA